MKTSLTAVFLIAGISTSFAQSAPPVSVRKGLFWTSKAAKKAGAMEDDHSMFSLGTLFGGTYTPSDPSTYKIQNNVVVFDNERTKFNPTVFALPSICLLGQPGKSLSAIVPVNLNVETQVNIGVGLSYGFHLGGQKKTVEVGIAGAGVWSDSVRLTAQQQASFTSGLPLPSGASTDFRTSKRPGFSIGIYLVPLF